MIAALTALEVITALGLEPHPEGGHYRETFRDKDGVGGRAYSTSILYLLAAGERSHWHRLSDAVEVWHFHGGAALLLALHDAAAGSRQMRLGPDLGGGDHPQVVVPKSCWQSAHSLGDWSLVGCTVAPGFRFESLEMAPPGWSPDSGDRPLSGS